MKRTILFLLCATGVLLRAESPQAAKASATLAACKSAGEDCRVSYTETEIGWLWKNGYPVNSTTTTVVREVKAPAPPPAPPVVVYSGSACVSCSPIIVVSR